MMELREGELLLSIPESARATRFDGSDHGLPPCMAAVDFVIEEEDRVILLEIKDFEHTAARAHGSPPQTQKIQDDLWSWIRKFRDSFIYLWALDRLGPKRECYVVLESRNIGRELLLQINDDFARRLPDAARLPEIVAQRWERHPVWRCAVLDIKEWNRRMPGFPIRRVSAD